MFIVDHHCFSFLWQVFGAQAVGENGVVERINTIAMALQKEATVDDLAESELCYSPQVSERENNQTCTSVDLLCLVFLGWLGQRHCKYGGLPGE